MEPKTKGAVKVEKNTKLEDVRAFLLDFKAAFAANGLSPPGGDKETMTAMSEARRCAVALQQKDIPIINAEEMLAVGQLKKFYSFEGRVLVNRRLVGPVVFQSITAIARHHGVEIVVLT